MPEQVIIEFISDTSQLAPAVDQLEKMGKVEKTQADEFKKTNTEIQKQVKTLDALAASTVKLSQSGAPLKKTLADINNQVKGLSKTMLKEFQQGAAEALKEAGVSALEFEKALEKATGETSTLKTQLRQMVEALAQMKVAGQDNTQQYRELAQQAGQLKDAIADANQEVKNFGSDTSTLDGVIGLAGGIAGGFAVAQGAAALFGDESEELQKTLLRVNAAMAILQGLQQVQTVLQKESAAATLVSTIALKARTAAQVGFNFVVGTSTGLLKAFRIALAATGIGLVIIGLVALISKMSDWISSTNDAEEAQKSLNAALEAQNLLLESEIKSLDFVSKARVAKAKIAGESEEEITKIEEESSKERIDILFRDFKARERIARDRVEMEKRSVEDQAKANQESTDAYRAYLDAIAAADIKALEDRAALAIKAREKAKQDAEKAAQDAIKLAKERRAAEFEDFRAGIELQLLATKEGSEEQLELRKKLMLATLQIDLENEKLTNNQRKLLIQEFFKERIDLEKKFVADRGKFLLEQVASDIQTELQQLELTNERKLELTETAINLQAAMEVDAANGNAAKIEEINAKRDKAIRDARIASIQEAVEYELALANATNGPAKRKLQAEANNDKLLLQQRISAIDQLTAIESAAIQKRIEALNKERAAKLISQKEYNLQYAQLVDEQTKLWEEAEAKKSDITKKSIEERKQRTIEEIQTIAEATSTVIDVLDSLFQLQSSRETNALNEQKQQLKDLQEAGAITEKEAIVRQKRIEADEKRIRQQQAQRDKQIAVFKALLAIPQAYLQGLSQGGPILAAIYGALAAASAAIVIARPIPKFGKGKKNSYEGPGEVGETGTELVEKDGRMYVVDKPQIIWLGKKDKVFNPQETEKMLSHASMNSERPALKIEKKPFSIDYKKLGKEVGKNIPQTGINIDKNGFQEWVKDGQSFKTWLNNRRSW